MIEDGKIVNGKYKITRKLGQGGMARVWLADEMKMDRRVAIKEPLLGMSDEENRILNARFLREIKVCAELVNAGIPNIVKALTIEPYEAGDLLIMEYMSRGDLAERIQENPQGLSLDKTMGIVKDVLEAIEAFHNHPLSIIHRDIKPSNILFDNTDKAHLGDFGLAQIAKTSGGLTRTIGQYAFIFTPAYLAPELKDGNDITIPQSDIFSLGCVIWEMLTGKLYRQYKPGTPPSTLRKGLPVWINEFVMGCLEIDPWERWANVGELISKVTEGQSKTSDNINYVEEAGNKDQVKNKVEPAIASDSKETDEPATLINDQHLNFIGRLKDSYDDMLGLKEEGGEVIIPKGYDVGVRKKGATGEEFEELIQKIREIKAIPIRGLDVEYGKVFSEDLKSLQYLTNLYYLRLNFCRQIMDEGLGCLKELKLLKHLGLYACEKITDAGLVNLKGLTHLEVLDLGACERVNGAGFAYVEELINLKHLKLMLSPQLTDASLGYLFNLNSLISLNIQQCSFTDAGLAHLKKLRNLRELDLTLNKKFTDAGIVHLSELPELTRLNLNYCQQITDKGLFHISQNLKLKDLSLNGCTQITDAGIASLSKMTNLVHLDLSLCSHLTDRSLVYIKKLGNLRRLDLAGCDGFTDVGLEQLIGLNNLRYLGLRECNGISERAKERFKK